MTPPDTDIKKQKRRHRPVIVLVLAACAVFVFASLLFLSSPLGPEPEEDATPQTVEE
ncbi:putative metal-binding membrane protein [Rhodovulum iodosum]|uniref:Metal-binding membrane protein n=1 Tax=Rhodovulum iodosum TaxID=68291 RepID=A0ABV3XUE8_9RHOB